MRFFCQLNFKKVVEAESESKAREIATQDLIESLSDDTIELDVEEAV